MIHLKIFPSALKFPLDNAKKSLTDEQEGKWRVSMECFPTSPCLPPDTHLVNVWYHLAPNELSVHVQKILTLHFP